MRIAFVSASEVAIRTAELLIKQGHAVIIIEPNQERIDELSDDMDCSFLHGDGSRPNILREVNPEETDVLFCLAEDDKDNLIASLVGRSLGFRRCVTRLENPDLEDICRELGLEDTIIPTQTISRYLADMVHGSGRVELSTVIKDEARFFSFTVPKGEAGPVADLELPDQTKAVCYYRDGKFAVANDTTALKEGDEVVLVTHRRNLKQLEKRWNPQRADGGEKQDGQDA